MVQIFGRSSRDPKLQLPAVLFYLMNSRLIKVEEVRVTVTGSIHPDNNERVNNHNQYRTPTTEYPIIN